MCYLQKLQKGRGQYTVTLPKRLVESIGLDQSRIVMIWATEQHIIHIEAYDAEKEKARRLPANRDKID